MPVIKLQCVVSCSSEDATHKADNLLKPETYRKWKCCDKAERHSSVILQFEKAEGIHSIDIGNESSAFVEVFVGHSTAATADFQVILVTSSFMSPMESKNGTNVNRVRMFGPDKLSKVVQDKKWDRVKIVCSQPFSKTVCYGLSFIKFHSPSLNDDTSRLSGEEKVSKLSTFNFRLKDDFKPSSITQGTFFRSISKQQLTPLAGAAVVRAASKLDAPVSPVNSRSNSSPGAATHQPRTGRKPSLPPSTTTTDDAKDDTNQRPTQKRQHSEEESPSSRGRENSMPGAGTRDRTECPPPTKKTREESSQRSQKPFTHLMKGVTLVLSGYKNPLRAEIRDKAMKMGAKYEPNWEPGCTHLICAFANTPKFQEVKGRGKIVTKAWVLDSYRRKTLLSWRRYSMLPLSDDSSSYDDDESDTDDELHSAKKVKPSPHKATPKKAMPKNSTIVTTPLIDHQDAHDLATETSTSTTLVDDFGDCSTTDIDSDPERVLNRPSVTSEEDTDDEIRRVQDDVSSRTHDISHDSSTHHETRKLPPSNHKPDRQLSSNIPDLPDFFQGKSFFLYGKFEGEERRQITRLIVTFEGIVEDYMKDSVSFVITNSSWDDHFDKTLAEHADIAFVRPKWIYACSEKSKLVPYQPYCCAMKM